MGPLLGNSLEQRRQIFPSPASMFGPANTGFSNRPMELLFPFCFRFSLDFFLVGVVFVRCFLPNSVLMSTAPVSMKTGEDSLSRSLMRLRAPRSVLKSFPFLCFLSKCSERLSCMVKDIGQWSHLYLSCSGGTFSSPSLILSITTSLTANLSSEDMKQPARM